MLRPGWGVIGLAIVGLVSGCRATTHIKDVPRVDLELDNTGNRGYLIGTPPPGGVRQTTRQLLNLYLEVPNFFPGGRASVGEGDLGELAPPEIEMGQAAVPDTWTTPEVYDSYVVQQGDSLWSIAGSPQVYGKATQWRRIFDANRDLLSSPGDIKAGMTLRIPPTQSAAAQTGAKK